MIDESMLRLNLLEMMSHSPVFNSRKRYSTADFMIQLEQLYQFSKDKPEVKDMKKALDFLIKRSLIDSTKMGSVDMYSITETGRDTLSRVADGDDTVIY